VTLEDSLKLNGSIILLSRAIELLINYDRRGNLTSKNNQCELPLEDQIEKTDFSISLFPEDLSRLNSTCLDIINVFDPIVEHLNNHFNDYFLKMIVNLNPENVIEGKLFLAGIKSNSVPLNKQDSIKIKSYIHGCLSESNDLINLINKTTYNGEIKSVFLTPHDSDLPDNLKYNNSGVAGFVHQLFNSTPRIARLASYWTIYEDNDESEDARNTKKTEINLTKPNFVENDILFHRPHVVYGTFQLESSSSMLLSFTGHYLHENNLTDDIFINKKINCNRTGSEKQRVKDVFIDIITNHIDKKVKAIIFPQHNYVSIFGKKSKSMHLDAIELIDSPKSI